MKWTNKEVQILMDNYGKIPTKEICYTIILGRTRSSLRSKANKINLNSNLHKVSRFKSIYQLK